MIISKVILYPITLIQYFFNSIINIGASADEEPHKRLIIQVVNLILAFGLMSDLTAFAFNFTAKPFMFLICSLGLCLNYYKYYDGATAVATVGLASLLFFNVMYYEFSNEHTADLIFLPIAVAAPLTFRNRWIGAASFLYIFSLLAIILWTNDQKISGFRKTSIYNIAIIFIISTGMILTTVLIFRLLSKSANDLRIKNNELQEQNKKQMELIHQNNLRTELLGILSHDLKGPAAAFNLLSKKVAFLLKKEEYTRLEELGDYFEVAGDKIYHDIDRLLNWTIAQKKNIVIREMECFPSQLIEQLIESIGYQLKDKSITFENQVSKKMTVVTDNHILEIIIKNLLNNAANHIKNGNQITITSSVLKETISILIHNPGEGIDKSIVDQAKEGKYRKSKTGHGLGLGICFSLIQFLNGTIRFDTVSKSGTTAIVTLPFK